MFSPLTDTSIRLRVSPELVLEINRVIDLNLDKVQLVALFISRLLKGLQDMTNAEEDVSSSWSVCTYEVEDIGIFAFRLFLDTNNGITTFAVDSVRWTFATSRYFSGFEY